MIGYITNYYRDKSHFQKYIFTDERFKEARGLVNIHSLDKYYPIEVPYNGMKFRLDEYRGYISGYLPNFHYEMSNSEYIRNLTYQKLSKTIDMLKETTVGIEKTNLSKLQFELTVSPPFQASQIIKDNILMFKMKGYNQDKVETSKKELKQFQYTDFTLGFYTNKKGEGYTNSLRIVLKFTKSAKLREMGIRSVLDLKDKAKLRMLFAEFLKRFDQLTIVDSISNYDQFSSGEQKNILLYMNVNYWIGFPSTPAGRKARERAKKNFKSLQEKYNLNTIKLEIRSLIEEEFEMLINN